MVKQRQSNFELLRIIAMLGIVLFHHFGSKIPNNFVELTHEFTTETYFYNFINNTQPSVRILSLFLDFCYDHFGDGGNMIFMTITGYFLYGKKYSGSHVVKTVKRIVLTIIYYGFVLTLTNFVVYKLFYPDIQDIYDPFFKLPNWISGDNLWYLQCYGVFLLVVLPIIKFFEPKINEKLLKNITISLVLLHFLNWQKYLPNSIISARILQFTMCYFLGGYIAKYVPELSWKKIIVFVFGYLSIFFLYEYYWRKSCSIMFDPVDYSFISVFSPFICCFIFALLMFVTFRKINISSKIINSISQTTIGIYIFHYNFMPIAFLLGDILWWHDWSLEGYSKFVFLDTILVFLIGMVIDYIRQGIFHVLSQKKIIDI